MNNSHCKFSRNTFLFLAILLFTALFGCAVAPDRPEFSGPIGIQVPDSADYGERVAVEIYLKQALRKGDMLRVYVGDDLACQVSVSGDIRLDGFASQLRFASSALLRVEATTASGVVKESKSITVGTPGRIPEGRSTKDSIQYKQQVASNQVKLIFENEMGRNNHLKRINLSTNTGAIVVEASPLLAENPYFMFSTQADLDTVTTSATVVFPTADSGKVKLIVNPTPADSAIKIMNIGPKYRDGIELDVGKYDVLVEKSGFRKFRQWFEINSDTIIDVALSKSAGEAQVNVKGGSGNLRDKAISLVATSDYIVQKAGNKLISKNDQFKHGTVQATKSNIQEEKFSEEKKVKSQHGGVEISDNVPVNGNFYDHIEAGNKNIKTIRKIILPSGYVVVAFRPDGKTAVGTITTPALRQKQIRKIVIFELDTGKIIREAVLPDERSLISVYGKSIGGDFAEKIVRFSEDENIMTFIADSPSVWNISTGKVIMWKDFHKRSTNLYQGSNFATTIDVSENGELVAIGGNAGFSVVYNIHTGEKVLEIDYTKHKSCGSMPGAQVEKIRISPNNSRIALEFCTARNNYLHLYDLNSKKFIKEIPLEKGKGESYIRYYLSDFIDNENIILLGSGKGGNGDAIMSLSTDSITSRITDGNYYGHTLIFSSNMKYFFTHEQVKGSDGYYKPTTANVYDIHGSLVTSFAGLNILGKRAYETFSIFPDIGSAFFATEGEDPNFLIETVLPKEIGTWANKLQKEYADRAQTLKSADTLSEKIKAEYDFIKLHEARTPALDAVFRISQIGEELKEEVDENYNTIFLIAKSSGAKKIGGKFQVSLNPKSKIPVKHGSYKLTVKLTLVAEYENTGLGAGSFMGPAKWSHTIDRTLAFNLNKGEWKDTQEVDFGEFQQHAGSSIGGLPMLNVNQTDMQIHHVLVDIQRIDE